MKTPRSLLPKVAVLRARLTQALRSGDPRPVTILQRKLTPFMCTFPTEIVTCRLPSGRRRRLFIKYAAGQSHKSFGHRGDVAYEAKVYQHLLHSLRNFRPRCLAALNGNKAETWLILEYINHSIRVSDVTYKRSSRQPDAMIEAARWLGEFHATQQTRIAERSLSFLNRYDSPYYNAWARRTYQFARPLWKRFHWLSKIKASADHWFAPLLESPPTIIHGEFYAKNLLLQRENVFTIDWESAAIAPGEIDLAALTEGIHWPESIVQGCQRAYIRSRWPQGEPPSFQRTLDAARMYLHFRWLGERRDWAVRARTLWRYEDLYQTARRLALF